MKMPVVAVSSDMLFVVLSVGGRAPSPVDGCGRSRRVLVAHECLRRSLPKRAWRRLVGTACCCHAGLLGHDRLMNGHDVSVAVCTYVGPYHMVLLRVRAWCLGCLLRRRHSFTPTNTNLRQQHSFAGMPLSNSIISCGPQARRSATRSKAIKCNIAIPGVLFLHVHVY
jgi:hypothetical protein